MDDDENIVRVLSYIYTGDGQLYSVHDSATGYTYIYTYDPLGRLIASRVEDANSETLMRTKLWYNASNQITKQSWTIGDSTYEETYTYNTGDGTLSAYHNPLGQTISLSYDSLRRLSTITAGDIYTQTYTYRDIDSTKTTTQVSSLSYSGFTDAPSFGYTYDELGNIATYTENGTVYTYTYDDLNQLLTATGGGKTYAYTYDLGGNILTASNGTTSHTYTYGDAGWADLLTAYDGQAITYDGSGNPLSYYNGSRYTFTWEEGRRLATASGNGHNVSYTYDLSGLRLSQTVDGTKTYSYAYIGDQLSEMTIAENGTVRRLSFVYDSTGPYAVTVTNGSSSTTYYYVLNLQGDVVAIVNRAGKAVVEYTYDPWGKLLSIDGEYKNGLGIRNPLRYRGYVYDTETELYYLQSRYYDSAIGRFINADSIIPSVSDSIYGTNLFSYSFNNPINLQDSNGAWPKWAKKLVAAVAVVVVVAAVAAVAVSVGAPIACAAVGAAKGAAVGMVTGAVEGAVSGAITHRITTGSWDGAGQAALNGMADGALEGAISGTISGAITSPYCFVAGTPVQTENGTKAIETIQPGDKVWAWDEETGDVAIKEVVETYVNETDELIHVFVNGEEIVTTPSHPFYSPVKGWTDAVHLRAGDILVLVNGEYVVVEKVQHEILEAPIEVYNFQVKDYHTYYVADSGVLVHNTCDKIGGGHGNDVHYQRIENKIDELVNSGDYTHVYGNRSLNTAGLVGNQRPDIIAIANDGHYEIWEFASKSQATGTSGYKALVAKMNRMKAANPQAHFNDIIPW